MPLFKSAHEALRFAYNYNWDNCVKAMIGIPPAPTGRGLGGLDGAAEAGNIKRIVCSKGVQTEMLVVAKFAPHIIPRSISKGWYVSLGWLSAIRYLARLTEQDCFSGGGDEEYRGRIIAKVFRRERASIEDIGKMASIPRSTAYRHFRSVKKYIEGDRTGAKGILQLAIESIESELRNAGIVGEEE